MTSRSINAVLPGNGRTADNKTSEIKYAEQHTDRRPTIISSKLKLPEEKGGSAMTKETTGSNKPDVQDEHAPSNIGPGTANKSEDREKKSQLEGPAAYAPHDESENSNR
jgi:hypothetical protein